MNARKVKLGDVCTVVSGATPSSKSPEYWNGDVVWITPAELTEDSYIVSDSCRHLTQLGVQSSSLKPFPAGTVILTSRAPIGKTAIAGREMYCNQGFKNLICSPYIYNKYLYCFLTARTQFLNSLGRGATFKELSKSIVENIEIYLPEINTQKFRAEILLKIKLIIQKKKLQLQTLDSLVKSRFVEMFGDLENQSRYQTISLGSISNMISGGTPSRKHREFFGGEIPFVSTPYLGPNYIDSFSVECTLTNLGVQMSSTHIIPPYSLLIGNRVGIGKCSINTSKMCTNQDILSFTDFDTNKYNILFIKKVIEQYERFFESKKRGATIKGVPSNIVKAVQIPQAPIEIQNTFASFVQQVDKSKFLYQFTLKRFTDILFVQRRHLYG